MQQIDDGQTHPTQANTELSIKQLQIMRNPVGAKEITSLKRKEMQKAEGECRPPAEERGNENVEIGVPGGAKHQQKGNSPNLAEVGKLPLLGYAIY